MIKTKEKQNKLVRILLIFIGIAFLAIMLIMTLITIIAGALSDGIDAYFAAISETYTLKALNLTMIATLIAVILNTIFGVAAAWAVTKFDFRFKNTFTTIMDLPFSISPVIAGLIFILTFGRGTFLGNILKSYGLKVVFAVPVIVLATLFVTFPFVAREIIPLMESQGSDEEEAAAMMGAGGFTIFRKITLPNIKWGLIYGIILCAARAMGEFGAVSVVSGHIRGKTNTLPLHVEILYNEYQFSAAFAVASILMILAVVILIIRNLIEWKSKKGA